MDVNRKEIIEDVDTIWIMGGFITKFDILYPAMLPEDFDKLMEYLREWRWHYYMDIVESLHLDGSEPELILNFS